MPHKVLIMLRALRLQISNRIVIVQLVSAVEVHKPSLKIRMSPGFVSTGVDTIRSAGWNSV